MIRLFPFLILTICFVSPVWAGKSQVLLQEDFEKIVSEDFASVALKEKFVSLAKGGGPDRSDAIRVAYVGYDRGSERVTFRYPLKKHVTQATLSYDVCFEEDFQWVIGGKLHGLGPAKPITGGRERKPDGWSARVTFKEEGGCATYLYDQNKEKTYGIGDKSERPVFEKGKWHRVELSMKLNDAGKSNGWARIKIDGREILDTQGVEFRGSDAPETLIQLFLFSTFHGGHNPRNAPVDESGNYVTVHALFDNFRVVGE